MRSLFHHYISCFKNMQYLQKRYEISFSPNKYYHESPPPPSLSLKPYNFCFGCTNHNTNVGQSTREGLRWHIRDPKGLSHAGNTFIQIHQGDTRTSKRNSQYSWPQILSNAFYSLESLDRSWIQSRTQPIWLNERRYSNSQSCEATTIIEHATHCKFETTGRPSKLPQT